MAQRPEQSSSNRRQQYDTVSKVLRRCVEVADSVPQDTVSKADYLADLAILSGLIFDYPTIRETIMEAIMHESSVIQHFLQQGIEQGIEQGARESLIEGILENLEVRFHAANLQEVKAELERIRALQRLRQLRRASLQASNLEAFQQTLSITENADDNGSP